MNIHADILIPIFLGGLFFVGTLLAMLVFDKNNFHLKLQKKLQTYGIRSARLDDVLSENKGELFLKDKENILSNKLNNILRTHESSKTFSKLFIIIKRLNINIYFLISTFLLSWILLSVLIKVLTHMDAIFSFLIGGAFCVLMLNMILKHIDERREKEFMTVFPLALDIISRGLKAGISVEKTFQTVANEIQDPVKGEFRLILQQLNFGVSFEQALRNAAQRIDVNDFNFFVSVLILQKKTGGTSSDLIAGIAHILRGREDLRRKIKALSAEAKVTGFIVGSLPILSLAAISVLRPEYIDTFRDDPLGRKLFFVAICLLIIAAISIKKLIDFKDF